MVRRETRVTTLSYTYNFGSSKNEQPRKSGGADDFETENWERVIKRDKLIMSLSK